MLPADTSGALRTNHRKLTVCPLPACLFHVQVVTVFLSSFVAGTLLNQVGVCNLLT